MSRQKQIGIASLVMISLAALGGIRNWAPIAECGLSSIFFLTAAILGFFIPLSLISAQLATKWPQSGGVYIWVKEAFGPRFGFLAIWFLWIQNVIWYPTILSFIAAMLSYVIDPSLAASPTYNVILILSVFWGVTFINMFGSFASSLMSSLGAICGTFAPSFLIILLGFFWFFQGRPLEIAFEWNSLIPNLGSTEQLALLSGVMVSLLGIEMSAVHAGDVKDPQKNYPKSILYSSLAVVIFSTLGVLGIAMAVPKAELLLNAGCLQAFEHFLSGYGLKFLLPTVGIMIALGALGSLSTWVVGPCKGLLASDNLPSILRRTNTRGAPKNLLLLQAAIVSVLSLLFLLMPSVNNAYWILMVLTTQLYLLMYVLLFSAALRLRKNHPELKTSSLVPGGKWGFWILGGLGLASSIFSFIICFFPPARIHEGSSFGYVSFLIIALLTLSAIPLFFLRRSDCVIDSPVLE